MLDTEKTKVVLSNLLDTSYQVILGSTRSWTSPAQWDLPILGTQVGYLWHASNDIISYCVLPVIGVILLSLRHKRTIFPTKLLAAGHSIKTVNFLP